MPNVNPGSATIVVKQLVGIENIPEIEPFSKLKCNFGSGNCKYTTGYSEVGKDLTCMWNRSATINMKTDEQIKFKIKSKNSQFMCVATLNIYQISADDTKFIDLLCFVPNKSCSFKSKPNDHIRSSSFGSVSLDMSTLQQVPLRLLVKAYGDIDFFRLQKRSNHRIVNLLHRSPFSKTPNKCKSTPNTPDHYDLKSISSLASISASKPCETNAKTQVPSVSIRRKLSYESSENSVIHGIQEISITAETSTSNSANDNNDNEISKLEESFMLVDNITAKQTLQSKQCCSSKFNRILNLNKILNELEIRNTELNSAVLKTSDQLDSLLKKT